MADNLRSQDASKHSAAEQGAEQVLGDKAVDGVDADQDHVPNVISGLKAAISNDNTSTKAKHEAEQKLDKVEGATEN